MLDFTTTMAVETYEAVEADRKVLRAERKWHRILRELDRADRLAADVVVIAPPARPGDHADLRGA